VAEGRVLTERSADVRRRRGCCAGDVEALRGSARRGGSLDDDDASVAGAALLGILLVVAAAAGAAAVARTGWLGFHVHHVLAIDEDGRTPISVTLLARGRRRSSTAGIGIRFVGRRRCGLAWR